MIYFSINSDKHFLFFSQVIDHLGIKPDQVMYIVHENPRNERFRSSEYRCVIPRGHPFSAGKGKFNSENLSQVGLLKKSIHFAKEDILMIPTEYELNNHIYADMMKSAGGKVYFFDEGIGTYFDNSPFHRDLNKSPRSIIKRFLSSLFFRGIGIKGSEAVEYHEGTYFRIDDSKIDTFFSSHTLPLDRSFKITQYVHFNALNKINLNRKDFFFCTSDFDIWGLRKKEKDLAAKTILQAKKVFDTVYVKIHPREYSKNTELLVFYENFCIENDLELVGKDESLEEALLKRRPGVVASSMSTSLFDAALLGCEPVFTYHLLPEIKNFGVYDYTLKSLGYNYIKSLEDISPEYKSNIVAFTSDKPLKEVLRI